MLEGVRRHVERANGHLRRCRYEQRLLTERLGYRPRLLWPRSFNEKLLRRRLWRLPDEWVQLADKAAAKAVVASRVGSRHVAPTYLVTDDADAVVFSALPPRFAVKATNASGRNLFVRGRADDPPEPVVRDTCREWLRTPYGRNSGETWYERIAPRILVEELLVDPDHDAPLDYKFWVFHGRAEFVQVDFDRFGRHRRTFYDREWRRQPWGLIYPPAPDLPPPAALPSMIDVAERLASGFDFVRIDLYCLEDRDVIFGEFTFAPEAGSGAFWPDARADFDLGRLW
jgi:hypothetical protein